MTEPGRKPSLWAVLPAAGLGRRFGAATPKQHLPLAGRSALERSLSLLLAEPRVRGAVVALSADDPWRAPSACRQGKYVRHCAGGPERAQSVLNALSRLKEHDCCDDDWVLVHDAARPLLRPGDLERLIDLALADPIGALLAVPVRDTLKRADTDGRCQATVDRTALWHAQTPQMFHLGPLHNAIATAIEAGVPVTDEAGAMERAGYHPLLVEGHGDNIKITSRDDALLAEQLLSGVEERQPCA